MNGNIRFVCRGGRQEAKTHPLGRLPGRGEQYFVQGLGRQLSHWIKLNLNVSCKLRKTTAVTVNRTAADSCCPTPNTSAQDHDFRHDVRSLTIRGLPCLAQRSEATVLLNTSIERREHESEGIQQASLHNIPRSHAHTSHSMIGPRHTGETATG